MVDAYCKEKGISSLAEKTKKLKILISAINVVPDVIKGITTSDFTSLIVIKNKIGGKSVILVFDDLERCRMDYVDVLGAINDYCENMKIHTIIVANQDKMRKNYEEIIINAVITEKEPDGNVSSKIDINEKSIMLEIPAKEEPGAIPYIEIKEKIIQRTVQYIPDFEAIIAAVIEEMRFKDETYKEFVSKCQSELLELFAPDRSEEVGDDRPHNIRSLKCAISDFYRVYEILTRNQLMFIRNRKLYIEQMSKDSSSAFLLTQNKRFNGFDVEMAKVTAKAFKNSSNEEKSMFSGYFKAMWNGNIDSEDMNFSESIEGFRVLLHELEEQKKHLEIQKKAFAKLHTEKFIELVRDLIDRVNGLYDMQQAVDELNDELRGEN